MGSQIEQGGEQFERKVTAIEKVGPSWTPANLGGCFQVMDFARSRKDKLLRHAFDPVEDTGDLSGTRLLTVFGPLEGGQRQFDKAGIDRRNPRELFAQLG